MLDIFEEGGLRKMRNVIIGDVHGCYGQLKEMLEKVGLDEKRDRLISVGDLMDRGPEPYNVFAFMRDIKKRMGDNCILIRGNHEQMLLDAYADYNNMALWQYNGAETTIRDLHKHYCRSKDVVRFITDNTVYYYLSEEDGFQCAHADIDKEDPAENDTDTLIWGRENISSNFYKGRLTIVGHTPISYPIYLDGSGDHSRRMSVGEDFTLPKTGMICIDTGCFYRGILTALIIENGTGRLEQVRG